MSRQIIGIGSTANDGSGDPLRTALSKTNSNFAELYAGWNTKVYDVTQYGAIFDGATDTSSYIQIAIDAARTFLAAGNYRKAHIVLPAGLNGILRSTLDFTRFTNIASTLIVDWNGVYVTALITGSPVIDALGSQNIIWNGVHVSGVSGSPPKVGIQIGRINTTATDNGGHGMAFYNCRFTDFYSLAPLYNFSGEDCLYVNCVFQNSNTSASSYCAILDGINHFSITSAFVTQSAPANTAQSFNSNYFLRCHFVSTTSGPTAAIWKGGCRQHTFENCYVVAPDAGYGFIEYCITGIGGTSQGNKFDVHLETNGGAYSAAGYFLFDGTLVSPAVGGFELKVSYINATTSVFKTQGSIASISIRGLFLSMTGEINSAYTGTFQVFDNPALWTIDGRVDILATYWNYSASQKVIVNSVPYITADMA